MHITSLPIKPDQLNAFISVWRFLASDCSWLLPWLSCRILRALPMVSNITTSITFYQIYHILVIYNIIMTMDQYIDKVVVFGMGSQVLCRACGVWRWLWRYQVHGVLQQELRRRRRMCQPVPLWMPFSVRLYRGRLYI